LAVKNFCLIILILATGPPALPAQTNAALPMPRAATRIDSDSADFDMAGNKAIYRGHVRVDDPQMKLTSERLVVDLPPPGGRVSHIVAETNVVIDFMDEKGQTTHATSNKAVYDYREQGAVTNETVTFTGDPEIDTAQTQSKGDVIIWDRLNNQLHFTNPKIISRQNLSGALAGTNPPAGKTNLPPVTIQKIDTNAAVPHF
jgi:lipopolysaccharide transport protein LptA